MDILNNLNIDIYADGGSLKNMIELKEKSYIKGFTTNPSLMKQSGVVNYEEHCKKILNQIKEHPVSIEIFSDDFEDMIRQAEIISSLGKNVNVKIPITNSVGLSSKRVIENLVKKNININITAIFTLSQVQEIIDVVEESKFCILSYFAGRVADTGVDPEIKLIAIKEFLVKEQANSLLLWASSRELLNIFHAERTGCDIITVSHELLNKTNILGKNLEEFSLDTVNMFKNDATKAGYEL
jgi:transaldolase